MGSKTAIEWTDATWNPIGGCSIASPGCINCYAQQLAGTRLAEHPMYAGTTTQQKGRPIFNGKITIAADDHHTWTWPIRFRGPKETVRGLGRRPLVFVGDMSDLFHEDRPAEQIDKVWAVMAAAQHLDFQVLTKRADRMHNYVRSWFERLATSTAILAHPAGPRPINKLFDWGVMPAILPNVWLGVSAERQQEWDQRLDFLGQTPAAIRFVSVEPMLGYIDVGNAFDSGSDYSPYQPIDWVICGGESGRDARPMHPEWARGLRNQCEAMGVPFFFKQHGEHAPCVVVRYGEDGEAWRRDPTGKEFWYLDEMNKKPPLGDVRFIRVGKKAAGRLLDGREWNQFPESRA